MANFTTSKRVNLYDQRISNAEYFQKEEEKKSVERVRTR